VLAVPTSTRAPSLVTPFAVVGGAAGWLSADFLRNPLVAVSDGREAGPATVIGAVVAAGIGALLTRWCATRMDAEPAWRTWARLAGAVVLGGAVVGGAVTAVAERSLRDVHESAGIGALASLAFVPICAAVLGAAKRAERARHGSLVAGSDRRAVWAILMAALSVTAGAAAIDWPLTHVEDPHGHVSPPWVAVGLLLGAFAVLAASLRADWAALARLRGAAPGGDVEERDGGGAAPDLPRLDLGLGDDVCALVARGSATYRNSERTLGVVVGSPGAAATALRRALRRDVLGLAVAGAVLGVHAVAACAVGCALPDRPPFQGMRCTARAVWDPVAAVASRP
jgi:hypothetical protein